MDTQNPSPGTPLGVGCSRVLWVLVGPIALAFLAVNIARRGGGWLTGQDIAYLVVLAVLLTVRWLEFRSGHGKDVGGQPLTSEGLRAYLIIAAGIGLVLWTVANLIGNTWPLG